MDARTRREVGAKLRWLASELQREGSAYARVALNLAVVVGFRATGAIGPGAEVLQGLPCLHRHPVGMTGPQPSPGPRLGLIAPGGAV